MKKKPNKYIKALVAGGAGFVGSHLCRELLNHGYGQVICIDDLSTGNLDNIKDLHKINGFSFIKHDITKPIDFDETIDEIYNMACPASPIQYQKNPIQTFKTSIYGCINLLELARQNKARILLASTSEVYGNPNVSPQSENYWGYVNPYGIRSCYDEGKRGAETLFHDYHEVFNVDTRIIRIFNTYGPSMSIEDGRVISNFIVQALKGDELTVNGEGKQTRSFQYIDDLIKGILLVMKDEVQHEPINLGNPNEISIMELSEIVLKQTGSSSIISYRRLPQDDPVRRKPDITLAKKILKGWEPRVSLEEGIAKTIEYFRTKL